MTASPFLRSLLLVQAVVCVVVAATESELRSPSSSSSLRRLSDETSSESPRRRPRIIGGSNVNDPDRYPYFALMEGNAMCGAVLISKRFVLTAAHCVGADNDFEVGISQNKQGIFMGSFLGGDVTDGRGTEYAYANRVIHPNYDDEDLYNDIALFELNRDVPDTVQYVRLRQDPVAQSGTSMTVIGFGDTDASEYVSDTSEYLQQVDVDYVTADSCRQSMGNSIGSDMLCAFTYGQDSCGGDSGGPLLLKGASVDQDTLVGLVSWGVSCADDVYPGVYTRISFFYDWIVESMCEMNPAGVPDYVDCGNVDVDTDVDTPPSTGTGTSGPGTGQGTGTVNGIVPVFDDDDDDDGDDDGDDANYIYDDDDDDDDDDYTFSPVSDDDDDDFYYTHDDDQDDDNDDYTFDVKTFFQDMSDWFYGVLGEW